MRGHGEDSRARHGAIKRTLIAAPSVEFRDGVDGVLRARGRMTTERGHNRLLIGAMGTPPRNGE